MKINWLFRVLWGMKSYPIIFPAFAVKLQGCKVFCCVAQLAFDPMAQGSGNERTDPPAPPVFGPLPLLHLDVFSNVFGPGGFNTPRMAGS